MRMSQPCKKWDLKVHTETETDRENVKTLSERQDTLVGSFKATLAHIHSLERRRVADWKWAGWGWGCGHPPGYLTCKLLVLRTSLNLFCIFFLRTFSFSFYFHSGSLCIMNVPLSIPSLLEFLRVNRHKCWTVNFDLNTERHLVRFKQHPPSSSDHFCHLNEEEFKSHLLLRLTMAQIEYFAALDVCVHDCRGFVLIGPTIYYRLLRKSISIRWATFLMVLWSGHVKQDGGIRSRSELTGVKKI